MELPPLVGDGFATVGVGPVSAPGNISAGRNPRRGWRWGWNRVGFVNARGVMVEMNFGDLDRGREARVSSVGYGSDKDWASWCELDE